MRTATTAAWAILVLAWAPAAFAAPAPEAESIAARNPADPWEPFNRRMFAFNEGVDKALLEPIARGYRAVTPRIARTGLSNLLANLGAPATFANELLQGEVGRAGNTAARFTVNTTVGVVGLWDPATRLGLSATKEDFGQTLGRWGVASGPYLFLPLRGPSTLRDTAGSPVDAAFSLTSYGPDAGEASAIRGGLTALSARTAAIEAVETLRASSTDPYLSVRTLYLRLRQGAVENAEADAGAEEPALPPLEEMEALPALPAEEPPPPSVEGNAPQSETTGNETQP